MRIAVFGLGYVGIVSAACLAERGHEVIGVDPSHDKVAMVAQGRSTIVEERIGELVAEAVESGRLRATADAAEAVAASDLALICVGTPSSGNGSLSTMYLERVADEIGAAIATLGRRYTVVFRSTMLPGTCEGTLIPRLEAASGLRAGDDFGVAVNPEFLREGTSVRDFNDPPKTVVGTGDPLTADTVASLYDGPAGRRPPRADRGRRDDEVRGQLVPRAQDRLRQRDGRDLPGLRRRLARRDGGLRLRHEAQHLARVPAPGLRVRRLVPAQGSARDRLPRAPRRPLGADPRERDQLQRGAPAPRLRPPASRARRAASRCSGWPSSRAPTICARARWSSSPSACSGAASTSASTTRTCASRTSPARTAPTWTRASRTSRASWSPRRWPPCSAPRSSCWRAPSPTRSTAAAGAQDALLVDLVRRPELAGHAGGYLGAAW